MDLDRRIRIWSVGEIGPDRVDIERLLESSRRLDGMIAMKIVTRQARVPAVVRDKLRMTGCDGIGTGLQVAVAELTEFAIGSCQTCAAMLGVAGEAASRVERSNDAREAGFAKPVDGMPVVLAGMARQAGLGGDRLVAEARTGPAQTKPVAHVSLGLLPHRSRSDRMTLYARDFLVPWYHRTMHYAAPIVRRIGKRQHDDRAARKQDDRRQSPVRELRLRAAHTPLGWPDCHPATHPPCAQTPSSGYV